MTIKTKMQGGTKMTTNIQWENDMDTALRRAKSEAKPVFLDFFNPG